MFIAIFLTIIRSEIPGIGTAFAHNVSRNYAVAPDRFASLMRILKAKCFHFLRRGFLLTACIIHNEEYELPSVAALCSVGTNLIHDKLHASTLHAIDAPRRMVKKFVTLLRWRSPRAAIWICVIFLRPAQRMMPWTRVNKWPSCGLDNSSFKAKMNLTIGK